MNIDAINQNIVDTTMNQAKFSKKINELSSFKSSLDEASKKLDTKNPEEDKKLMEMCQEFEEYFIKEMYKSMKKTINYENFIGYSQAESIFSDMLDDEYAKEASKNGGIGLAKTLYDQLKEK